MILINLSCSSKAQIVDIYNSPSYADSNIYYKDLTNFQNQFEGTWIYQQGLTYLEVQFRKKQMMSLRPGINQYYADVLVGEYKYVDANGVVKVNSLSNLIIDHPSVFDYNIFSGQRKANNAYPVCNSCPTGTLRLRMHFDEPANDDLGLSADFIIRHVIENGVEKLIVTFINTGSAAGFSKNNLSTPSTFTEFSLPYGSYTLIKQ